MRRLRTSGHGLATIAGRRGLFIVWIVLLATSLRTPRVMAAENYEVIVERNVAAKMRDGVTLRADIYRPKADGKFPVLLVRTPYDKTHESSFGMKGAARGYVVVEQDVRGRFESEGEWYTFKNESADGYDTVEWAAALPYSNGKVGMFGGSYVGATQFLAAIAKPPHLAGIAPTVTASNYHDGWTYQGGAFEQWFNESWSTGLAENTMRRRVEESDALGWTKILPLRDFPVIESPSATGIAPYFTDWLAHPDYDAYWKQWSIEDHYANIQVPVLSFAAWYDIFLGGSLRNYSRLKTEGGTEAAKHGQRLMVYVGGHAGGSSNRRVGAVDFGEKLPIDQDEITLRWYDWIFKGQANGVEHEKPVKIFVMGKNEWRDEDDWPLARAKSTKYYLHSAGLANGLGGNGTLSTATPAEEKAEQFVYDPADAAPTIGGSLCCGNAPPPGNGPQDQRPAESRSDVLAFTTPAFGKDFEVTGPVTLDLYVSSSAVDTDFTGMLVDVWPNGFAQNLTSGILRMRYRNSQEKPELANPGETYHVTVDLWATSNVFLVGHKLRLEVSSSNFPRFDRNLNTGEIQSRGSRMIKATNVIYHDKAHPSSLILPVVP
ncbi:MAG TPA: CocE/NonD family hydrolase [Candidatus Acidoferrum sp.]|nr:CocE/NonD family hydrolase [Candidatus Acidoferrum sp.]